jgi:UDP-glucose 4-epimerase
MSKTGNGHSTLLSTWLVTGGAGYIGGHVMQALGEAGIPAVLLDIDATSAQNKLTNLSTYENCNVQDKDSLAQVFSRYSVEGVIHLAALKSVEESQRRKNEYFQTNVIGTRNILELMIDFDIKKMIFSSTAAVYDAPTNNNVIDEDSPLKPISYYGKTKLEAEGIISDYTMKHSLSTIILRYFNVGGSLNSDLKDTSLENLIPITISKLKSNQVPEIFGDDYETPDGTAIRDYVDVRDVTDAHMRAIKYLKGNTSSHILNIGTGNGYSVREIIEITKEVMGINKTTLIKGRREGDISAITADIARAKNVLDFEAKFGLHDIIQTSIS